MTQPDLRALFRTRTEAMVARLSTIAAMESPTDDKAAVDALGRDLAEELAALGGAVTIHPREAVGDIVEAAWHADAPGKPLLFVCHMDTVHPVGSLSQNPVRLEEGKLYGPGTYDMKASIVVVAEVLRTLIAGNLLPGRPITVLLTSDEETGSDHSRDLIMERARSSALSLIMEPALPDGSLKTWRKSVGHFVIRTTGIAAHAGGAHESGLNAIEEMAHHVLALQAMTDYKAGTTVSVGVISGGTRSNVVPEFCEAQVDTRAMTLTEVNRLTEQIYGLEPVLPGAQVEVSGGFDRPPMERNALMIETFGRASAISARYGLTLRESGTGGGSDGNYTAGIGAPTLDGLGPLGDGGHTSHEYTLVNAMPDSAALLAALLLEW
jgi:glutamate carboxypeptidase